MSVTYLLYSYSLDPHNVNMLVCLRDWYRWHWTFNIRDIPVWTEFRDVTF